MVHFALRSAVFKMLHILLFPSDCHVKPCKLEKKIYQKFKIGNFTIILIPLAETFPGSIRELWGMNLVCMFIGDVL